MSMSFFSSVRRAQDSSDNRAHSGRVLTLQSKSAGSTESPAARVHAIGTDTYFVPGFKGTLIKTTFVWAR